MKMKWFGVFDTTGTCVSSGIGYDPEGCKAMREGHDRFIRYGERMKTGRDYVDLETGDLVRPQRDAPPVRISEAVSSDPATGEPQ